MLLQSYLSAYLDEYFFGVFLITKEAILIPYTLCLDIEQDNLFKKYHGDPITKPVYQKYPITWLLKASYQIRVNPE